jgi:cysteine desulfurase/selenocysteine lyase
MSLPALDVARIRKDFPILERRMHGQRLAFLDSAASAQKPRQVIETLSRFYAHDYANIHRGVYELSEVATRRYEEAREKVACLLGASSPREIVFTRNATEAINLVASSWGRRHVGEGDEILVSHMEHHANIVPWQLLCEERGARLSVVPIDDSGELMLEELEKRIGPRTRLVSITHVSNALGTINPVAEIVRISHERGVPVLLDGAQAVPRMPVDVAALDCEFYVFSGHKVYGPTGIGALYAKAELLEAMPPYQGGGEMITSVTFEKSTWNEIPHKFEAGTPAIAEAVGLGAAVDYLTKLGLERTARHEDALLAYGSERLREIPGLRLIGTAREKTGVLSFVLDDVHPHDLATILDQAGVAIRAGHHCAQPVMQRYGVPATARASLGLYNDRDDIDQLVDGIGQALEVFR